MKTLKFILLILALTLTIQPTSARKVDVEKAEILAKHYVQSKRRTARQSPTRLRHVLTKHSPPKQTRAAQVASANDSALYYAFNIDDNGGGFVIVAGDDVATPVLGYSDHGSYDENNAPENFLWWMDGIRRQILYARENNLPQSERIRTEWENYLDGTPVPVVASAVAPLIQTTWNQDEPYNNSCPEIGGVRTLTGCVATTMAQIMKYYNYPARGTGQSRAYSYTTEGDTKSIPSVNFDVDYDWDNMLNSYSAPTSSQERNAVATLMYHCGVSVRMEYGPTSSGAFSSSIAAALLEYFGYDGSILFKQRSKYDDASWESMLRKEIDARRPVSYDGYGSGGHTFICDGYDEDGKFHFNWGWGGFSDGYFATTALYPSGDDFNENQAIIVNIKPDEGGVPDWDLALRDLTSSDSRVERDKIFTVSCDIFNIGYGKLPCPFIVEFALTDDDDNIAEIVGTNTVSFGPGTSLSPGYYTPVGSQCRVSNNVPNGEYKLRVRVKPTDGEDWKLIETEYHFNDIIALDIEVVASSNANLQDLYVAKHSISPTFSSDVTTYTLSVPANVESVTINAQPVHDGASVSGDGTKSLTVGANEFNVTVTAEDGTTTKTYTVTVTRADFPVNFISFTLDDGVHVALKRTVGLKYTVDGGTPVHFRVAESEADLNGAEWRKYDAAALEYTFVTDVNELKTVYSQLKNAVGNTSVKNASIYYKAPHPKMQVTSFGLSNYATSTRNRTVSLNHTVEDGVPLSLSVSENPAEVGNEWRAYETSPLFTLSEGTGLKTVYFVLANDSDSTEIVSAQILLDESGARGLTATLYPNPVEENYVNVETDCKGIVRVNVYGLRGETYLSRSFENSSFRLDLSDCPSGILLVRISGVSREGKEVYTVEKIIKNN